MNKLVKHVLSAAAVVCAIGAAFASVSSSTIATITAYTAGCSQNFQVDCTRFGNQICTVGSQQVFALGATGCDVPLFKP